ncbi:MAG: carbohydrate kinase, thermoresistant glucokinase family protein [Nevskia sp.]|nr:carbohydrate kinase, thermoresistant glucokinase family protein [Nevskia sp.]
MRTCCVLVVMGVSGCGKTTVARRIATQLGWAFQEGDAFHSAANIAKMHAGTPLTDVDRTPWLATIEGWIDQCRGADRSGVITCSALKNSYRAQLLQGRAEVRLLYLRASEAFIAARLRQRVGHFMPAALLHSQFTALEEPGRAAAVCVVDIEQHALDQIVAQAVVWIGRSA